MGRAGRPGPLRALVLAPLAVSRRGAGVLGRLSSRGAEHAVVAAQLASVRFRRGLDLRAWRRNCRRHGARREDNTQLVRAQTVPDQAEARQKQQTEHDVAEMLVAQRVIDARAGPCADQRTWK